MPGSILSAVADALAGSGIDLPALGLAWARAMPSVVIVPAFGLRALPLPARGVIALALAASIAPALQMDAEVAGRGPWALALVGEAVRGLPVAIAAAIPLWAATMAGGVADALRDAREQTSAPIVEGRASQLGVVFSILASALFLASGGPARIAVALASRPLGAHPLLAAAHDLVSSITIAVALGAPLLAAALVVEVAGALVARAATPAQVHALLAPVRAVAVLAIAAVVFDRIESLLARLVAAAP